MCSSAKYVLSLTCVMITLRSSAPRPTITCLSRSCVSGRENFTPASSIAMELAGVKFSRPLTHDLLKQVIVGLGAELRKVIITQVKDNTYFAELHIYRGDTVIQIDARPSDSIALALRLKAPILTSETLLELTSVDTSEGTIQPGGSGSPLDADTLKSYLQNLDP